MARPLPYHFTIDCRIRAIDFPSLDRGFNLLAASIELHRWLCCRIRNRFAHVIGGKQDGTAFIERRANREIVSMLRRNVEPEFIDDDIVCDAGVGIASQSSEINLSAN